MTSSSDAAREAARSSSGRFGEQRHDDASVTLPNTRSAGYVETEQMMENTIDMLDRRNNWAGHSDVDQPGYLDGAADLIAHSIAADDEEPEHIAGIVRADLTRGWTTATRNYDAGRNRDDIITAARDLFERTPDGTAITDNLRPHYWDGVIHTAAAITEPDEAGFDAAVRRIEHEIRVAAPVR